MGFIQSTDVHNEDPPSHSCFPRDPGGVEAPAEGTLGTGTPVPARVRLRAEETPSQAGSPSNAHFPFQEQSLVWAAGSGLGTLLLERGPGRRARHGPDRSTRARPGQRGFWNK